jgi:hypothetical protein
MMTSLSPPKTRERFTQIPRPGLTLRQNKHVLRASRGKGAPQITGHTS